MTFDKMTLIVLNQKTYKTSLILVFCSDQNVCALSFSFLDRKLWAPFSIWYHVTYFADNNFSF